MKPLWGIRPVLSSVAILVVALAALVAGTPATAHADDTVGISISTATKGKRDPERTRFSYQIDPGQTVNDYVWVANAGTKRLKITLFATDAYNTDDGSYALLDTDEKPVDAGSWVAFRKGKERVTLNLKPDEATIVPFTLAVPANAAPGDRPAGIVAAAAPTEGAQLGTERRIAVRLYARVSGDLQPGLTISSFDAQHSGGWNPMTGAVTATAVLSNTGNIALGGTASLDATSWFGLGVGEPAHFSLDELLPGSTRTVSFQIPDVPQVGFVNAHLVLRSSIGPDAPAPETLPTVQRDAFVPAIPWTVVGLLALVMAGLLGMRVWGRRNERLAAEWVAYTEAEALRKATEAAPAEPVEASVATDVNAFDRPEGDVPGGPAPGDSR